MKQRGYRMRQKSKKQAKRQRELAKIVREIVAKGDARCQLRVPGVCTGWIEGAAHILGRGVCGGDARENIEGGCCACNGWCADNPAKAKAMGLIKQRRDHDPISGTTDINSPSGQEH